MGAHRSPAGTCHGPSVLRKGQSNTFCSPCRLGHPEDCGDGVCFEFAYTGEHYCTYSCSVDVKLTSQGYSGSNDTCPKGLLCFGDIPHGPDVNLPDLVVCRPELGDAVLRAITEASG